MNPRTTAVSLAVSILTSRYLLTGERAIAAEANDTLDAESSWKVEVRKTDQPAFYSSPSLHSLMHMTHQIWPHAGIAHNKPYARPYIAKPLRFVPIY